MQRSRVRLYTGWGLILVGVAFIVYGLITARQNQTFLILDTVFGAICIAYGLLCVWEARRGKAFLTIRFPFTVPAPRSVSATVLRMALIAVGGAAVTFLFYVSDQALYHSQVFALISVTGLALLTLIAVIAQPFRYNRQKREHAG